MRRWLIEVISFQPFAGTIKKYNRPVHIERSTPWRRLCWSPRTDPANPAKSGDPIYSGRINKTDTSHIRSSLMLLRLIESFPDTALTPEFVETDGKREFGFVGYRKTLSTEDCCTCPFSWLLSIRKLECRFRSTTTAWKVWKIVFCN